MARWGVWVVTRHTLGPCLLVALVSLVTLAFHASVGRAQSDPLAPIREEILHARYPEAISAAMQLLERRDLDARTRNVALELLATAQIANGASADARRTLTELYARDPEHRLTDPDASPPVISAFARARESARERATVRVAHRPPTVGRRESPLVEARIEQGADAVDELRLVHRQAGDPGWSRVVMNRRADGTFTARIPLVGPANQAQDVAYYLVATAPSGAVLAGVGSEAEPLALRIPAELPSISTLSESSARVGAATEAARSDGSGGGSVVEEWWFWTLVGALVAGGVVTGVVLATQNGDVPDGTLGTVVLMR